MISNRINIIDSLSNLLKKKNLVKIKSTVQDIKRDIENRPHNQNGVVDIGSTRNHVQVRTEYLLEELDQIFNTQTIERTKYYIQRLIHALSDTKTSTINDLNIHRWKEYDDILTDSLWV